MNGNADVREYISEPERKTAVTASCDVLVCGGGIAGISAALAAARCGAKVILLEREFLLGGLATLGLVTIYLPLCDGRGRQVSFGIAEELLRLSAKHGLESGCGPWLAEGTDEERKHQRFRVQYNPNIFALEAERLLTESGVKILYGTCVCGASTDHGRITHIIIENKSGRSAIETKKAVDATGDADICRLAGEDTVLFSQGNVSASWYYSVKDGRYSLNIVGASDIPDSMKTKEQLDESKNVFRFGGVDGEELSDAVLLSHRVLLDRFLESGDGTPEKALACVAAIPQVRMTRRLAGVYTQDDGEAHKYFGDSTGMFSDWRRPGPVYELPFSALYGKKIKNLLAAGRCISVTDAMWDITRVIPVCAVSGQAAGTAAAMFDDMSKADISALQEKLTADGVILHE